MTPFERAVVIFNPQSTGEASQLAQQLHADLATRLPDLPVDLAPTEHGGHGRELAREAARRGRPLIVSVSGDGGYNEVVDGIMQSGNADAVGAYERAMAVDSRFMDIGERVQRLVAGRQ